MAITSVGACVVQSFCLASETIICDGTIPVLLILEHMQNLADSLNPLLIKDAGIACLLPVSIGKTQRIAQRINFVFALMQLLLHCRIVRHPMTILDGFDVEGISIRINKDAGQLTTNNATNKMTQWLVLIHIAKIGPNLCCTIAKPHCLDVASNDEGVVIATLVAVPDSCIERIREAVDEHPIKLRINCSKFLLEVEDLLLNSFATEKTIFLCRTKILNCALYCHLFLCRHRHSHSTCRNCQ